LTPRGRKTRGFFAGVKQARLMRPRCDVFRVIGGWLGSLSGLKRLAIRGRSAPQIRKNCDGAASAGAFPAPVRHAFVISRLKPEEALEPYRHRYTCLHCRWNFLADARGRVVAVDAADRPVAAAEAARRLASFADSSCPGSRAQSGFSNHANDMQRTLGRRVPRPACPAVAARVHHLKNRHTRQSR
jgi:hypothetical protein